MRWMVNLTQATLQRFHPSILSPGSKGFAARFNAASLQYADVLADMGREAGNAALLAMAAETLLVPEAWAYTQVSQAHIPTVLLGSCTHFSYMQKLPEKGLGHSMRIALYLLELKPTESQVGRRACTIRLAVQDATGHSGLDETGQRAAALIAESLQLDPDQPLALHLHIHLTEAGSPVK